MEGKGTDGETRVKGIEREERNSKLSVSLDNKNEYTAFVHKNPSVNNADKFSGGFFSPLF